VLCFLNFLYGTNREQRQQYAQRQWIYFTQALFVLDDGRLTHDATARLVRFSDIYTTHQQTTTCFKIDSFKLFFIFFSEFQNEGGREPRRPPPRRPPPRQPPPRRRTGLILLYRTSGERQRYSSYLLVIKPTNVKRAASKSRAQKMKSGL
jgi:hypothetical protein